MGFENAVKKNLGSRECEALILRSFKLCKTHSPLV